MPFHPKSFINTVALIVMVGLLIVGIIKLSTPVKILNPKFAVAEVYSIEGAGRSRTALYRYSVDDHAYNGYLSYLPGMAEGDKYEVSYENNNPKKHILLENMPVFTSDEEIDTAIGQIISKGDNRVRFQYLGGQKRFQYFDNGKYSPKVNEVYRVIFWRRNSERAIIYLDRPIPPTS
jgi:hypothetical protein